MTQKEKSLDRLYVSSPCNADWETMPGSEQVRFCGQCSLNVYNISALTKKQAEKLIAETEGRLCAKLYRRADGTIITRDCPTGFASFRKKSLKINEGEALQLDITMQVGSVGGTAFLPKGLEDGKGSGSQLSSHV